MDVQYTVCLQLHFFFSVFASSQVVRLKTIHSICVSSKYGKVASNAEKLLSRYHYHSKKFISSLFLSFFPSVFVCVCMCISLSHFVIDLQLVVHVITGNTYLIFNITCIFEHMDEKVQTKNIQLLKKVNCTGPM